MRDEEPCREREKVNKNVLVCSQWLLLSGTGCSILWQDPRSHRAVSQGSLSKDSIYPVSPTSYWSEVCPMGHELSSTPMLQMLEQEHPPGPHLLSIGNLKRKWKPGGWIRGECWQLYLWEVDLVLWQWQKLGRDSEMGHERYQMHVLYLRLSAGLWMSSSIFEVLSKLVLRIKSAFQI